MSKVLSACFLALTLLLGAALPASAAAPLVLNTNRYALTYPDGWSLLPGFPATDSTAMMMSSTGAVAMIIAGVGPAPTDLDNLLDSVELSDEELVEVSRSNPVLGGKTFTMAEYRNKDTASEDADARYRVYLLAQNGVFFMNIVMYQVGDQGAAAVSQAESALAGLTLKGGSSIRRLVRGRAAVRLLPASAGARDLLGRAAPAARLPAHAALFVKD